MSYIYLYLILNQGLFLPQLSEPAHTVPNREKTQEKRVDRNKRKMESAASHKTHQTESPHTRREPE
jgi:hypothetical protein